VINQDMHTLDNILVVKLGGGSGLDLAASCDDLAALAADRPLVVVHGVSALANRLCEEAGRPVRTLTSPSGHAWRYTDAATRDIYARAAGAINAEIVSRLRERGRCAVGLADAEIVRGERKTAVRAVVNGRVCVIRDDYTGSIIGVDAANLLDLLRAGCVPVVPPLAASPDGPLNVDGDRAAAAVAAALGAAELVILSNVRGLYRSYPDESSLVSLVRQHELERALEWAGGRMKRKVLGAREALAGGVRRVILGDGRVASPVQRALTGHGTVFAP